MAKNLEIKGIDFENVKPVAKQPVRFQVRVPTEKAAPHIEKIPDKAAQEAQAVDYGITMDVDAGTHQIVIKVLDKATGQVITQFPAEELVRMSEEEMKGSPIRLSKKM